MQQSPSLTFQPTQTYKTQDCYETARVKVERLIRHKRQLRQSLDVQTGGYRPRKLSTRKAHEQSLTDEILHDVASITSALSATRRLSSVPPRRKGSDASSTISHSWEDADCDELIEDRKEAAALEIVLSEAEMRLNELEESERENGDPRIYNT
ncbi:hypothetical protein ScalyP_jg3055 [Parmales sp. scaly parma]|nr:hypothetical protein ScalyP_jg3055 [Parmales sp. scaly parma]